MSLEHSHRNRIHNLQRFGFSRNESLVYLCLLESDSADGISGYEVAARAEVPRSAVYTLLNSLIERGAVSVHGKPQRFFAVPPEQWLKAQQQSHTLLVAELHSALTSVAILNAPKPVWIIRRYREIIDQMQLLIARAESFIGLSLLPAELEQIVLPTSPKFPIILHCPAPYAHPLPGSCWIEQNPVPDIFNRLVLIDGQHILQGHFSPSSSNEVVHTSNPSLYDTALCTFEQRLAQAAQSLAIGAASDVRLLHAQKAQLWKN